MRKTLLLASLLMLSACAATGEPFVPKPPAKGEASLVVYRPSTYAANATNTLMVNGHEVPCRLLGGGYVIVPVPAGHVTLTTTKWGDFGTSMYSLQASPGKQYPVRVQLNHALMAATIGAGLIGSAIVDDATYTFRPGTLDEALSTRNSC